MHMYEEMKSVIILLFLAHTCLALTCWDGKSNEGPRTIKAPESSLCVRYYYCQDGWIDSDCPSFNTSIIYTNSVNNPDHLEKEIKNVLMCKDNMCNSLISPNTVCNYGYGIDVYLKELDKKSKYCYSENRNGIIYYSITDTCKSTYIKCCTTNYCNEAGASRLSILVMFIIMVIYLDRIEL